ncbi:hypothetical protein BGZ76_011659 [Entomortierella beljakovae]|nr:hypothetical protein BGZ76_011659 [Entomortierella beljakovae]
MNNSIEHEFVKLDISSIPPNYIPILPNECLFIIVEHLSSDIKALHTLLFVNRFFFHAAVPYIYEDVRRSWTSSNKYRYQMQQPMTFTLSIASFIESRLKEAKSDPSNIDVNKSACEITNGLLKRFGLKLTHRYATSGSDLIKRLFEDSSYYQYKRLVQNSFQYSSDGSDASEYPIGGMTVDYSRFNQKMWLSKNLYSIVRLRKLPKSIRPTTNDINDGESSDEDSDELVTKFQNSNDYETQYRLAAHSMWLHYNGDCISILYLDMAYAHFFLQYATKMSKLDTLYINRSLDRSNSGLDDTILFIKTNQSAFPRKKTINIFLGNNWSYSGNHHVRDAGNMDLVAYMDAIKRQRVQQFKFYKPLVDILEATGSPRTLDIRSIPFFYNHAQQISANNLWELLDNTDRSGVEESRGMEEFLRRCYNLRILRLGVGNEDPLSWIAVKDHNESLSPPPRNPLEKLEKFTVTGNTNYRVAIQSFNNGILASPETLNYVTLEYQAAYRGDFPNALSNLRTLKSIQLRDVKSANTIGDWNVKLLNLQHIKIDLLSVSCIDIGSLDACPNLEHLSIRFGRSYRDATIPVGSPPPIVPGTNELLDPQWQQAPQDHTLFPIWNLPKLKALKLHGHAALRFDFASIPTMKNLEILSINTNSLHYSLEDLTDYLIRQNKIPLDRSNISTEMDIGIFGSYSSKSWTLQKLKDITICGPPVHTFYLDWLRLFPNLEVLYLSNYSKMQHIYRRPLVEVANIYLEKMTNQGESIDYELYRRFTAHIPTDDNTPNFKSRLSHVTFRGLWKMSQQDITVLLTVFACNLKELFVDQFRSGRSLNGYKLFKAIQDADIIKESWKQNQDTGDNTQSPSRIPSTIVCRNTLRKCDKREFGLVTVDPDHLTLLIKHNIRRYKLLDQTLAHKEDYAAFLKSGKLDR